MLNLFTLNSFKTWKAKTWIVNCQDLGAWNCKKVAFQNLAGQVLNKKDVRFQTTEQRGWHVFMSWKTKSWKNCWHRSNVELIYPQQFQDLESQILNTALSRLGGMELQRCDILNWACQVLNKLWLSSSMFFFLIIVICFHFLEDQIMKDTHYLCQTVSRLRKPSLEECRHEIAKTCQKCGYQVLTICFTSVHVFKDQVIKDTPKVSRLGKPSLE